MDEPFDADHHSSALPTDDEVSARVREALLADSRTSRLAEVLGIETVGGVVIVRGTVQDIEEERRLFYVGITRARQRLEMLRCKHRVTRGKPVPRTPCRFLLDIPDELLEHFEVKDASPMSVSEMAANATNLLAMLDAIGK